MNIWIMVRKNMKILKNISFIEKCFKQKFYSLKRFTNRKFDLGYAKRLVDRFF